MAVGSRRTHTIQIAFGPEVSSGRGRQISSVFKDVVEYVTFEK